MRQVFVWLLLAAAGFAQGGLYNDTAFDSTGRPAGGATVRVCSETATGTPCSPAVTVYSDKALSTVKTTVTADANGNFNFYAPPRFYKLQVTKSGSTYTYVVAVADVGLMGDVRHYGASGNGTANDVTAINSAIAANDSVYFPKGTYRVNSAISVNRNGVHLYCEPGAKIEGHGAINILELGDGSAGSGLTFAGLFEGSISNCEFSAGDATVLRGIYSRGAREWDFYNVRITGVSAGPVVGFATACVEMRESWVQHWYGGRCEYSSGDGFYLNSVDNNNNDIHFFGTWSAHNTGVGFKDTGGSGRRYETYVEENAGGGISLSAVQGFSITGGYLESNTGFDIKVAGSSSGGSITGGAFINAAEDNHKHIWLVNAGGINLGGFFATTGNAKTGDTAVYVDTGCSNIRIDPFQYDLTGGASGTKTGGSGLTTFSVVYNAQSQQVDFNADVNFNSDRVVTVNNNTAAPTMFALNGGASSSGTGIHFNNTNANAASRNWWAGQNQATFGDFSIVQSNARLGNPLTAGTSRFYIDPTGQIGIGNTSPGKTLDVTGTGRFSSQLSSDTYATNANCSSSGGTCSAAAAGSVSIAAAATTVTVATTAVTASSQIILTRDNSLGTKLSATCNTQSSLVLGTPYVSARTGATSFVITIDVAPTTNPLCISYQILN